MKWIDGALKKVGGERTKDTAWLNELQSILHEANNIFDDLRYEGGKLLDNELPSASSGPSIFCGLPTFSCFNSIRVRHNLANRIRALNNRIDEVAKDQWIFNLESVKMVGRVASMLSTRETCEIMEADVVGREIEDATDELVEMIATNNRRNFQVIAVAGMGGIGKTTLAQKVYNNPRIWENFQALGGRSIFLVLDDVWRSDVWTDLLRNPLRNGAAGGCVLVEKMTVDSGWELLCKKTYLEEEGEDVQTLRSVGVRIVNKCGGLSLAIKGSSLLELRRFTVSSEAMLSFIMPYPEVDGLYLGDLRRMWVAEGFVDQEEGLIMEVLADQYYFELIRRSLLQPYSIYGDQRICESREIVTIPGLETEQLRLRTLLLFMSPPRIPHNLFSRFPYLQVLLLNGKGIECIPDSVGNLIRLRLLDLDRTSITKLPDSIGLLRNLQALNLHHCEFLNTLPKSITHLCSLRQLGLFGTSLRSVPEGIGRLQLLNDLTGFIINADNSCNTEQNSWDLEELKSLCQLRWLQLSILGGKHNANSVQSTDDLIDQLLTVTQPRNRASVLEDKAFLKQLIISCTLQSERVEVPLCTQGEINRIEDTFEKLRPPTCLEDLLIYNFYGHQFSSWMVSSSLGTYLPYLTYAIFIGLPLCSQLPSLGQLPHLRHLSIKDALAIVTISSELLGNGVGDGVHAATAFPKLEFLFMMKMPNWEEWSLVGSETGNSSSVSLRVMPRLEQLHVVDCPKLRALPKGLQQLRALRILDVERAHSLSVIEDFLFITQLKLEMNNGIEMLSNLPALKKLTIWDSPGLKCVDNLVALQYLELQDYSMESLPEWLFRLVQQRVHLQLVMRCSATVIQRCLRGGLDWPIIECFSRVSAYTEDRSTYLEYTKQNGRYRTNQ
ncbi:putative disease resistance protein RGA3 [Ananas comosus]|uniref:Disease resistance protein RGA3 n=1 Tax=Ananas comosus TaxID=4615 RepID=A0A6P5ESS0_ANACO|nr:putative disease resistance protein RGA3 [Ananas comosus]